MIVSLSSVQAYGFPKPTEDPKKKNKEWITQYGRAIWSDFMRRSGNQEWYHGRGRYNENLLYARGEQSLARFREYFRETEDGKYGKPWEKLNLKMRKIMPRYFRIVQDKLDQVQFDAICTPIDTFARNKKEEYAASLKLLMDNQEWMQSIGIDPSGMSPDGQEIPIDQDDLQMRLDTWQNQEATDLEIKLAIVFNQNDWEQIDKELDDDCKYFGACLFRDYTLNGRHYIKRIDPRNGIIPPSPNGYEDHRDLVHAGYIDNITLGELRAEAQGDIPDDELNRIAESLPRPSVEYTVANRGDDPSDSQSVQVFRFQFKSKTVYTAKEFADGKVLKRNYKQNADKLKQGEKIHRIPYNAVYEGTIILGTDKSYGCRMAYHQKRDMENPTDCLLNIHAFIPNMIDGKGQAMAEEIQSPMDSYISNWLKLEDAKAKAMPKGFIMNHDWFTNVALNYSGKDMTAPQLYNLMRATGEAHVKGTGIDGQPLTGSPIMPNPASGLPDDVEKYLSLMIADIRLIQEITGINDVTAGTNTNPEEGKRVAELKVEASISSLSHLFRTKRKRFEAVCKSLAIRIRQGEKHRPIVGSVKQSNGQIAFVGENKELGDRIFDVSIENRPSAQEWESFYRDVDIALANKEITAADKAAIRIVKNLKQAYYVLAARAKRNEKKRLQEAQMLQQQNGDIQVQSAQAAEQAKQATIQVKLEADMQLETHKQTLGLARDRERYAAEYRQEELRVNGTLQGSEMKAQQNIRQTVVEKEIESELQENVNVQ